MKVSFIKQLIMAVIFLLMLAVPAWIGGDKTWTLLHNISLAFTLLLLSLVAARWASSVWRWQLLLAHTGYHLHISRLAAITLAIDFASENTPAATGGGAAALWLFKRERIPIATSISCCALFLSFDVMAVLLLLSAIIAALATLHSTSLLEPAMAGGLLFLLATTALWSLIKQPRRYGRLATVLRLSHLIPARFKLDVSRIWRQIETELNSTAKLPTRTFLALMTLALINWATRFSFLYVVIHALGGTSGWASTAIIQFVSTLAGLFTLLPGGYPGTDISIIALLHTHEPLTIIFSALLLWRLVTYHVTFIVGLIAATWLWLHRDTHTIPHTRAKLP